MTENLKIKQIMEELFQGKDAALTKYARVRHTQYELSLTYRGLPIYDVAPSAKVYFSKRFLGGENVCKVYKENPEKFNKAMEDLDHAVRDGCHGRCTRLVKELNEELAHYKIEPVDSEKFLDWLTFCYDVRRDYLGEPIVEPGFSFEIRDFYDDKNRKEFWEEAKALLKKGYIMPMGQIGKLVMIKRNHSKKL